MASIFAAIGTIIYSFHMYAFFFISGFVSLKILNLFSWREKTDYIMGRAKRLLVPYCVMGVVYLPARLLMAGAARNDFQIHDFWKILIGENPDGALWFLYILFLTSLIAVLLSRIIKDHLRTVLLVSFLVCFASHFVDWPIDVLYQLLDYSAYFLLGIFVRVGYSDFKNMFKSGRCFVLSAAIFMLANVVLYFAEINCTKIITALSGTFCVMYLAIKIISNNAEEKNRMAKFFNAIGNYSMDIYIFSEPVKVCVRTIFRNSAPLLNAICCTVLAIAIPVVISKYVIRKVKIFRVLFLGSN